MISGLELRRPLWIEEGGVALALSTPATTPGATDGEPRWIELIRRLRGVAQPPSRERRNRKSLSVRRSGTASHPCLQVSGKNHLIGANFDSEVHFVEMDPWVVSDVLRPNLEETGFLDASVIHTVRVEKFFERAEQFVGNSGPFDYISVTPPYTQVDYGVLMRQISESPLLGENTFIVVEYPLKTDMLDSCGNLVKITDRRFGRTLLAIYGPTWSQKKR
ncbi:uncharacterized protein LOC106761148 [Vigna radiata var. radiata]|uniref:Uncharacterized protein LOC106761148 n=1 Tax=Vigna radiata var. radiata TaxID=3916 RepID=A0A3Q0EVZ1_VIGRR|nr:uncharacterized protein LOC106761148 [Vigna radiata var. radiata]